MNTDGYSQVSNTNRNISESGESPAKIYSGPVRGHRPPVIPQPRVWLPDGGSVSHICPSKAKYTIVSDKTLGAEGYELTVARDGAVSAVAPAEQGLFWARRTVDQLAAAKGPVPTGTMRDIPKYRVRGVMLDVGRKFVRLETLRAMLKDLAHYKMNEFHIHLNDDGAHQFTGPGGYSAFRLECETFPELTSKDGHYSKDEFRAFVKEAAGMGINVIPEIDTPAHSGCFIRLNPGLEGKYGKTHLALDKQEVRDFIEKIFAEYLDGPDPVFAGKYVHVGTDEYDKREAEAFRAYTDWAFRMVRRHGHEPRSWGSLDHAAGKTPVIADRAVQMDIWHNPYYDPVHALDAGYSIVAVPDLNLYVVPAAGYYFDYLETKDIFENWEPCTIAGRVIDPNHPGLLGGKFAIWNDLVGNGISEDDIIDRFLHAVPVIAEKTWSGRIAGFNWDEFSGLAKTAGEAPGVNLHDSLTGPDGTPGAADRAIGWHDRGAYEVSFDLEFNDASKETVLFDDGTSQVKLFKGGQIGFSRDGYDWAAPYPIPPGEAHRILFYGTCEGVAISADGQRIGDSRRKSQTCRGFDGKPHEYLVMRTLHFPLAPVETDNARVRNFSARAIDDQVFSEPIRLPANWPDAAIDSPPQVWESGYPEKDGVKSIFYEGIPYKGKPTRVFAYVAVPDVKPGETIPGIVLVHGGTHSCYRRWAKYWRDRGYAAISMDTSGCVSGNEFGHEALGKRRHEWAGPQGWPTAMTADSSPEDHWTYHAVSAVLRANSLLRSIPGVDPCRIGVTGVSWGGFLTCIAAGVDRRFAFAAPVYGCGFIEDHSWWTDMHGDEGTMRDFSNWCAAFDPKIYLPNARGPFLFIDGTNDEFYPLDSLQKTCETLTPGCFYYRSTRLRMRHDHFDGSEHPKELVDFADWLLRNGDDYPYCESSAVKDGEVHCSFYAGKNRIERIELEYTKDTGRWQTRKWETVEMDLSPARLTGKAKLPEGTKCWFVSAFTEDGKCVSGDLSGI